MKKRVIRKILILGAWLLVISGMVVLLVAANRPDKARRCQQVYIALRGTGDQRYIDKNDVQQALEKESGGNLLKRRVEQFNLAGLERSLEKSPWIRNAELYFDSKDGLHVNVDVREPVARVITTQGVSQYVDTTTTLLPLLEKVVLRLPVITNFPAGKKRSWRDSTLARQAVQLAELVRTDKFWNAQTGQINITPEGKFEITPVVGDQVLKLGAGEDLDKKLHNLWLFYKDVLSKTGLEKYAAINAEFNGQIVAIQKGPVDKIDSLQLQKNIEALLNKSEDSESDL